MELDLIGDDRHRAHNPPFELNAGQHIRPVWERPERIDVLTAALTTGGATVHPPEQHDESVVLTVHDPGLVRFLREGHAAWRAAGGPEVMIPDTFPSPRWNRGGRASASPFGQAGWWCMDTGTPIVAGSYAAARAAVDIAVSGADRLAAGAEAVFALTRPPGHHTGADYCGGFCLFNPAAIAARRLTTAGRVVVLDLDVHHGNGTQDIFWRSEEVCYVSLHADPDHQYPFFSGAADEVGAGPGRGANHNLPLPPGTGDEGYLAALTRACMLIDAYDPVAVLVSLGWDTAAADPIGHLALSAAAYPAIGAMLRALGRPLLIVQEGGYAIDELGGFARGFVQGLVQGLSSPR